MNISNQIETIEGIRQGILKYTKNRNKFSISFFVLYTLQIISFFFFTLLFLEYVSKEIIRHFSHIKEGIEVVMVEQASLYHNMYTNLTNECLVFLKNAPAIQDYLLLSALIFLIFYTLTKKFNFISKRKNELNNLKGLYKEFVLKIVYLPMLKELFPNTKIKEVKDAIELDHIYSLKNVNIKIEDKKIELTVKDNLFTKKREEKEGGITTQILKEYEEVKGIKEVDFNQKRFRVEVIITLEDSLFDIDLNKIQLGKQKDEDTNLNIQKNIIELVKKIEEDIVKLYY